VNPAEEGWQIVNRKVTGSSKLALNTATKEQAKALAEHPKLKEVGLRAEVTGRWRPRMVVYDIPMDRPNDEILEAIITQNFGQEVERDSIKSQLRLVLKFSNRRAARDRNHWICEVTPELQKNLTERQRLFVDFNSCRVDAHLGITRCYKCQGFGHVAKKCRQQDDTCSHCADNGHQRRECPRRQEPPRCAVCRRYAKESSHDTRDNSYPALKNEPDSPN
jgi:Arginine methyltransferase-interacting protein, contains RING Zn-finger